VKLNKKLALAVASAVLSISSSAFAAVDFMNDDAPFKTDLNIAGHNGDLQFYGIIDIGYGSTDHSYEPNNYQPNNFYSFQQYKTANGTVPSSQSDWFSGGLQASRIGLKGGIDLFSLGESKIKLIGQLETGFNPLNGELLNAAKALQQNSGSANFTRTVSADSSLNGQFFNRQAWTGIDAGQAGKLTFGLQYNPFYTITTDYDPLHHADTFSPLGESGTVGGGGGVSENSRMANSFKYANSLDVAGGKLTGSAMYQHGNASGRWDSNGRGYALQAGYENNNWMGFGVQVSYNNFTDAIAAATSTTANDIKAALYNTDAWLVAFQLKPLEDLKLNAGYEFYERKTADDSSLPYGDLWGIQVSGYAQGLTNGAGSYREYQFAWAGLTYDVGHRIPMLKDLEFDLAYYSSVTDATHNANGANGSGDAGRVGTWSALLDYKLNKRFDTYLAYTHNDFSGAAYSGSSGMNSSQEMAGVGVRMKF